MAKVKKITLTKKELTTIERGLKEAALVIKTVKDGCYLVSVLDALEIVLAKK